MSDEIRIIDQIVSLDFKIHGKKCLHNSESKVILIWGRVEKQFSKKNSLVKEYSEI